MSAKARSTARVLLRTPRLSMREFTPADFDDMLLLDSDPRVLKYINDGKPMGRVEVEAAVSRVTGYYALYPGLGVWRASRRDNGDFVGWYCLKYCPPTTEVEVGYRLLFDAWGKGFATEGARALVAYGFEQLGLQRIIGVTHPGNKPRSTCCRSRACATRAGVATTTAVCGSSPPIRRTFRLFASRWKKRTRFRATLVSHQSMPADVRAAPEGDDRWRRFARPCVARRLSLQG